MYVGGGAAAVQLPDKLHDSTAAGKHADQRRRLAAGAQDAAQDTSSVLRLHARHV